MINTGRRQDAIDNALTELGENAIGVQGDVGNLVDLDRLVAEAERCFGRIDVYFANVRLFPERDEARSSSGVGPLQSRHVPQRPTSLAKFGYSENEFAK